MAKYNVYTQSKKDLSAPEKKMTVTALDRTNAEEIALTYNKESVVVKCVRVGKDSKSTYEQLMTVRKDYIEAMNKGAEDLAQAQRNLFGAIIRNLKKEMNVVGYKKAEKRLPSLPEMG